MRKCAFVHHPHSAVKRLMIYESEDGVYLFGYDTLEDAGGLWDEWYEVMTDAEAAGKEYGVASGDWRIIPDPLPDCQQDWIAPVRVKGRAEGNPQWGQLEKLQGTEWVPFLPFSSAGMQNS